MITIEDFKQGKSFIFGDAICSFHLRRHCSILGILYRKPKCNLAVISVDEVSYTVQEVRKTRKGNIEIKNIIVKFSECNLCWQNN